jgi:hypothetical protein
MPDTRVLEQFGEFCLLKKSVNGPDVHMKAAGTGTQDSGYLRPWRLAVYNNFCSTPTAAVIWSRFPETHNVRYHPLETQEFIAAWWPGLPIRQNRRPARSVPKLAQSLITLATWMDEEYPKLGDLSYDEAWKSLDSVYTWGRYVKIKFLETARRYLGFEQLVAPNIEAAGGWSPRKALSFIYPEYERVIANKSRNDKRTLAHVYSVADEVRAYVSENWVEVSNYELEALLCNYKQTLSTRKAFYVGRTIDSELEYDAKIRAYWGDDPYLGTFDFFRTRRQAFPDHTLGEYNDWDGVRKDLSNVLSEQNYIWSDTVYDYQASKEDLANPVRWSA